MVIIDLNFASEDSYVYFGADPLASSRITIGESLSAMTDEWALTVDSLVLNG